MNEYYDDIVMLDEELVDISSSGVQAKTSKKGRYAKKSKDQKYYKSSNQNQPKNNQPKNKNTGSKKKVAVIATVAVVVAVAVGVTCFCMFFTGKKYDTNEKGEFIFGKDMQISGLSVAGKTYEEAKAYLISQQNSLIKPKNISVDVNGDTKQLKESDFKYTFDTEKVLTQAMNDEKAGEKDKTYQITATPTDESISSKIAEIEKTSNKEAQDARVSKFHPYAENRFEFEEEQAGYKVDSTDLSTKLKSELASSSTNGKITAKVDTVEPKTSLEFLKNNLVKRASYETYANNKANSLHNMKVALEACNGSVIEPGATWSFNECTGDSNLESNGYLPSTVISGGQYTDGVGGGLCQSSSTIYNAGIRADMGIEERYPHLWCSTYVDTGFDATIDYPNLDLKMSNKTNYQMFLECQMIDSTLYVAIWGIKPTEYDVIKTANELTDQSGSEYTVKAWRVYYKDGKEIKREELPKSTYDLSHGLIYNEADINDTRAVDRDLDDEAESETDEDESEQEPEPQQNEQPAPTPVERPTQKPTQAPTPRPTEAPQTEAPVVTDPVVTEPIAEPDVPEDMDFDD